MRQYLEILGNLADQTLEGQLPDQEIGRLLVATDFAQGDRAGAETSTIQSMFRFRCITGSGEAS
jgi:hypothetical protein